MRLGATSSTRRYDYGYGRSRPNLRPDVSRNDEMFRVSLIQRDD